MKRIVFVTCSTRPGFAEDDLPAVQALEATGAVVTPLPWDGDFNPWTAFDAVVLRSTWNYHLHPEKFLMWLSQLQTQNANVFNSADVVRWNIDKNYLKELSRKGIPVPPTVWLAKGSDSNLLQVLKENGWNRAVVKPTISATAHNTFQTSVETAAAQQEKFTSNLKSHDLMVQQFMAEVAEEGEWSLIFFNKQFSHAVLKKPKAGDFRVQENYGGTTAAIAPPQVAIEQAKEILKLVKEPLLYTRVDGVISNGRFVLMELELIEPVLFLQTAHEAAKRFADTILAFARQAVQWPAA